ncbi:aminoglycoside phosphotransferase family protein [Ruegeria arenilitoris]|uniref:aminoglycoside phosphotransferase family protein n=1 Tax=Ruegeria arenilitoris TaxID=1173585 RepID=UPI0014802B7F|nr:aminoglycoside phosphotransferase family protein [Ruegeria arenilitoris]
MPILTEDENRRATEFVAEFSRHAGLGPALQFDCVYRSHGFPDTRLVLRVQGPTRDYAMKIDTASPESGRLKAEFDVLTRLERYFDRHETSRVVHPYYLSPGNMFFVTEFIDRPTAVDVIHNSEDDDQVARIYRRAGAWLNDLHSFQPATEYEFRPRWMTLSIRELVNSVPPHIVEESQSMVKTLKTSAQHLKGIPDTRVFSHGDFHGQNLIVGKGEMIGLDFTEVREKLAVYDIVDFLKSDIFRDADQSDVDRSGILKLNKDMFFRGYRHPIHIGILDFCIRGRLLKDWLASWHIDHNCSAYEEDRRRRLGDRLQIAFQQR